MAGKEFSMIRITDPEKVKRKQSILSDRIQPVDFTQITSVADLVEAFSACSIQARNIGLCAKVFERMLKDKERPTILLGLAGPLIAAGLRKVIRDIIEYRMVDAVVSTGAILYQDYYAAMGAGHFVGSEDADDTKLRDLMINRIYDTYIDEERVQEFDTAICKVADALEPRSYSSREFLWHLAGTISDEESILVTARKRGVPIFSPALNDSSIGIGLTEHYVLSREYNHPRITIDAIRDNYELTQIVVKSNCTAAIYVAGGVPKNFINDSVVMGYIFGRNTGGHKYAFQVTADAPHWGGLSGSTISEARSWGKVKKDANFAMAFVEPSVSFPLVYGFAYQKELYKERKNVVFTWSDDTLDKIEYLEPIQY